MKTILKTLNNILLCIQYPFLYPRDKYTDLHYNNKSISDYIENIRNKAFLIDGYSYNTRIKSITYYIWYYLLLFYYKCVLQIVHCIPSKTILDNMPDAWRKKFGISLCSELRWKLLEEGGIGRLLNYRIDKIRQKYGVLRWISYPNSIGINKILEKYRNLSYHTCYKCGDNARFRSIGYILPYCEKCSGDMICRPIDELA